MAITLGTIKSLLLFFGPILLPKALAYYRSLRASPQGSTTSLPIVPVPSRVRLALLILTLTILTYLTLSLPYFSPPEIFTLTSSRLQTPTDVLFTRLSTLRPSGLTPSDHLLRSKLNSLDSRLLYLQYGPTTLTDCTFCTPDAPNSYLYYTLPSILLPHLINLFILGAITSPLLTLHHGPPWRTTFNLFALALALLDIYILATFTPSINSNSTSLSTLTFFHWTSRTYRFLSLSLLLTLCGILLHLSSTNRLFPPTITPTQRVAQATTILDQTRVKLSAIGILQNTVKRDAGLRERSAGYWVEEGRVTREVMEEREVVEGVQNALGNRVDLGIVGRDAESYAETVMRPFREGLREAERQQREREGAVGES